MVPVIPRSGETPVWRDQHVLVVDLLVRLCALLVLLGCMPRLSAAALAVVRRLVVSQSCASALVAPFMTLL